MGGRSSKSGMTNSGGNIATPIMRSINKNDVNNWLDNANPGLFLSSAPESITVNEVRFDWIGESQGVSGTSKVFRNQYQSSQHASNGEWPVIETVVKEVRRGRTTRYTFDRSTLGSGLK